MAEGKENLKYKGLKPEIASEIEGYETAYFREDKPVPFVGGLLIYPATMREYETFSMCTSVLTLNKNEVKEGLRMSNLEFLLFKTREQTEEAQLLSYKLQKLLEIVFHIHNGIKCTSCDNVIGYHSVELMQYIQQVQDAREKGEEVLPKLKCPKCGGTEMIDMIKFGVDPVKNKPVLFINGVMIRAKDFDRLRQIILFQNFSDYRDDSWVDPAIKKDYQEKLKIQAQKNGNINATVEEKMVALTINTSYKLEDLWDMTIRKFTMMLRQVNDLIDYKITKAAIMSGFSSLPKGQTLEHWLYHKDKDMYGDSYRDAESLAADVGNLS